MGIEVRGSRIEDREYRITSPTRRRVVARSSILDLRSSIFYSLPSTADGQCAQKERR